MDAPTTEYFHALCSTGGIQARRYRSSIFLRRRAATLRALKAANLNEGIRTIETDQAAAERAFGAIMIGVTCFFRDPSVFASLAAELQGLDGSSQLNVMSVGCSDGSELYSVAMLLDDVGLLDRAQLLGIDCRPSAIAAARAAMYLEDAAADVPPAMRTRYFEPVPASSLPLRMLRQGRPMIRVIESLRQACQWEVTDAFQTRPAGEAFSKAHIILCRNLAIYLTPEAAGELWSHLVNSLHPGGLLVVGKAERPPASLRRQLVRISRCIYRRISDA